MGTPIRIAGPILSLIRRDGALGLPDEQVDAVFKLGATL